jgi:hypothetical protein
MPHFGHEPGVGRRISGCMGHVYMRPSVAISVEWFAIAIGGGRHRPAKLALESPGQGAPGIRIPVDDERSLRSLRGRPQPPDEPVGIGVGGETVDRLDARAHGNLLTEDHDRFRALLERPAAGAGRLKSDDEHGRPGIGKPLRRPARSRAHASGERRRDAAGATTSERFSDSARTLEPVDLVSEFSHLSS